MPVLERTQEIPAPLESVWKFFSDPANLARITPAGLRFRIVSPRPAAMQEGSRIEYRIRWIVFRLRWVTRITRWQPLLRFEDVQEKGPYRRWTHTHSFESLGPGVTRMRDRIEYELPLGLVGALVHVLFVRRQLAAIFDYRRRAIEEIFGAPEAVA